MRRKNFVQTRLHILCLGSSSPKGRLSPGEDITMARGTARQSGSLILKKVCQAVTSKMIGPLVMKLEYRWWHNYTPQRGCMKRKRFFHPAGLHMLECSLHWATHRWLSCQCQHRGYSPEHTTREYDRRQVNGGCQLRCGLQVIRSCVQDRLPLHRQSHDFQNWQLPGMTGGDSWRDS